MVFSDPLDQMVLYSSVVLSPNAGDSTGILQDKTTKPGKTCKQNKTGIDTDLSSGLLFPNEISKVYLN